MADSLILMVLALVVFGPRRLPQIGRQIGKLMYEFRKASNDFKFQMEEELRNAEESDRRKKEEERLRALALAAPAEPAATIADHAPAATTTTESPYPNEGQYPALTAPEAQPEPAQSEEAYPRIQPPSTGEQVPAARPTSLAVQVPVAAAPGDAASVETGLDALAVAGPDAAAAVVLDEASSDETTSATEQAVHHG
jgi:sec-independent protein translocase protein TatB